MNKFEYCYLYRYEADSEDAFIAKMDKLGAEGWELVSVEPYYFKRKIQ